MTTAKTDTLDLSEYGQSAYRSYRPLLRALAIGALVFAVFVWGASLSLGWFMLVLLPLLYFGPVAANLVDDYRGGKRLQRLESLHLEIEASELCQREGNGTKLVAIDLAEPFTFEYLYKEEGISIYRLQQAGRTLDFPSTDPLAPPIAKQVLHVAWPPTGRRPSP